MPHELRGNVIDQMIAVAGANGLCMISYWNGTLFLILLLLRFRFVVVDQDSRGKHYRQTLFWSNSISSLIQNYPFISRLS